MTATFSSRIQRLRRLQGLLPGPGTPAGEGLTIAQLLPAMGDAYGQGAEPVRRRGVQRDLDDLAAEGLIETVNPGSRPLRYRQVSAELLEDEGDWQQLISQIRDLIPDQLPRQRLERLLTRLQRAQARLTKRGPKSAGVDRQRALVTGPGAVGRGTVIDLELRARGQPLEMLRARPLTPEQRIADERLDAPFPARVWARLPETEALSRWLLGWGADVEVVAPVGLRQVMAAQTRAMARHYAPPSTPTGAEGVSSPAGGADFATHSPPARERVNGEPRSITLTTERGDHDHDHDHYFYHLLRLLEQNPVRTQRELAAELGISHGTVNRLLRTLADHGYLQPDDYPPTAYKTRRSSYLPTPAGIQHRRALARASLERKAQEHAALHAKLALLDTELTRLRAELDAGQDGAG